MPESFYFCAFDSIIVPAFLILFLRQNLCAIFLRMKSKRARMALSKAPASAANWGAAMIGEALVVYKVLEAVPKIAIWLYPQYPFSEAGEVKSNFTATTLVASTPVALKREIRVADWRPPPIAGL